jgi:hypothetical protein
VYPNVRAAGCGLVGAGGVLGLRPRGSRCALAAGASPSRLALRARGLFYEFVSTNLYKKCTNSYIYHIKINELVQTS